MPPRIAQEALSPAGEGDSLSFSFDTFSGDFQLTTEGRVMLVFDRLGRRHLAEKGPWRPVPLDPEFQTDSRFILVRDVAGISLANDRRLIVTRGQKLFNATREGRFAAKILPPFGDIYCWVLKTRELTEEKLASITAKPVRESPIDAGAQILFGDLGPVRKR